MLRDGPMTSGDIAKRFDTSWATISRHLSVLASAGLVLAVREGQNIRYELNTTVLQSVIEYVLDWNRPGGENA